MRFATSACPEVKPARSDGSSRAVHWWHFQHNPGEPDSKGKATMTAALSYFATYGAVRVIRVLQEKGRLPGGKGLSIKGHHVHHYLAGVAMLVGQAAVGTAERLPFDDPRRATPLGAGLALIADEFDVLTGQQDSRLAQTRRPRVEANLLAVAALVSVISGLRERPFRPRQRP